jgi:membrane protease YdiL (CAAX protease family)
MEAPAATLDPRRAPEPVARPVLGFALDLLVALAVMLTVSVVMALGWSVVRGMQISLQHDPAAPPLDHAQLVQLIGTPGPLVLLLIAAVGTGSAALVALAWRRRADRPDPVPFARAWRLPATWGWAGATALATLLLAQLVSWMSAHLLVELTPSNLAVLEPGGARWPWLMFAFAVLAAPLYEELLFRRVLFARLWHAGRPWLALVLSSLAFALVHEPPGLGSNGPATTALLWLVYAGMGAAFAWSYRRTGTLWTPIGAHALHNLVSGLGLFAAFG